MSNSNEDQQGQIVQALAQLCDLENHSNQTAGRSVISAALKKDVLHLCTDLVAIMQNAAFPDKVHIKSHLALLIFFYRFAWQLLLKLQ